MGNKIFQVPVYVTLYAEDQESAISQVEQQLNSLNVSDAFIDVEEVIEMKVH